jgi:hypothetical protein
MEAHSPSKRAPTANNLLLIMVNGQWSQLVAASEEIIAAAVPYEHIQYISKITLL